ncbi:MAG: RimK family alpha-L-glutamate ligase [Zetaproteobacteria bacterium]|nr:MAG: RimK family alpha-L-glutamate ligase [Zetaproteobacteria bacterium]
MEHPAQRPLIGLAPLTRHAFHGGDLTPTARTLHERILARPDDAAAYMDLATIMLLAHQREQALELQNRALSLRRRYTLERNPPHPGVRLLALMAIGDLMDNTPIEFLLADAPIALELDYVREGDPPPQWEGVDLCFVAVGESDRNRPLLQHLQQQLRDAPVPLINAPDRILHTSREAAAAALRGIDGLFMPAATRMTRTELEAAPSVEALLPRGEHPVIIRPVASHAGHGLARIDKDAALTAYLAQQQAEEFYVAPYIDYASPDGRYRKYRIALIDGAPFLCHLAISDHWLVHYLNADMTGDPDKREEEARAMARFDRDFGARHGKALAAVARRLQLEYLVIDCAECRDGRLLIFEVDTSAIVHDMDPEALFPYKRPHMRRVFAAFQQMLVRHASA